jgi:glycine/D-amino acid oxidase-like deaminating enzyme
VDGPGPTYPQLDRDIACEVAIIGGGITGAMCAHELVRAGVDCVVLDRRELCHGSTAASTGLLQYEIDTPLVQLRKLVGRAHADRAYRLCVDAVNAFEPLVAELRDRCDLHATSSLYLAREKSQVQELRDETDARRSIGIDAQFLDEAELNRTFRFVRPGAIVSSPAMAVDPYRLALRLIERATDDAGMRAYAKTEVAKYYADEGGVTLRTSRGPAIRARDVVFATGYETPEFFPRDICKLRSTYAVAGEPVTDFSGWRDRCLIWESGDPYFYARTTADGRPIVGGEDEDTADPAARDALIGTKTQRIVQTFNGLFPAIEFRPACAWAGTFAQTKDGLPYIGRASEFPRGLFALGYGGNGIVFGLIAARVICDAIRGIANDDAEIFRFTR